MSATTQTLPQADGDRGSGQHRDAGRRFGLRGMPWLVWRQHRVTLLTMLAVAAAMTAVLMWLSANVNDAMAAVEAGNPSPGESDTVDSAYRRIELFGLALACLPVLIGVFVGAPLFAGDLESGTAKFVGLQSRSRGSWVAAKLGLAAAFSAAAALATGLAMRSLWSPLAEHRAIDADFTSAAGFDTTGPVAVALALLGLLIGAAAGLLLRRTLPAMVATFGVLLVLKTAWSFLRMSFASTVTKTTGGGRFTQDDAPLIPDSALEVDVSYLGADGSLHGWGSCAQEADNAACLRETGIVGWSVEYLPYSHIGAMQWAATGALCALLALTAAVTVYAARRILR
ncbi:MULTISPECIES: ABC transporter permease [unclassified Streptomyces]|uniref:ABC transporter permease n=1 Tax=unclassified Streptomyces TaxID=2593676 RepID=UPI00364C01BA